MADRGNIERPKFKKITFGKKEVTEKNRETGIEEKIVKYGFKVYDTTTKIENLLPFPFACAVLFTTSSVTGYNKNSKNNFYSNETFRKDQKMKVFCDKDKIAVGLYSEIQGFLKTINGKYTTNIYAIVPKIKGSLCETNYEIVKIEFLGSSLKEWINFDKVQGKKINGSAVIVKNTSEKAFEGKKYSVPEFGLIDMTPESNKFVNSKYKTVKDSIYEMIEADQKNITETKVFVKDFEVTSQKKNEDTFNLQSDIPSQVDDDNLPF